MYPRSIDWRFVLPILLGTGFQLAAAFTFWSTGSALKSLLLLGLGMAFWTTGSLIRKGLGIGLLLVLPILFPIIGPLLFCLGMVGYFLYRPNAELFNQVEFSEYKGHLVLPGVHLKDSSTLERVRKLEPAGDILKGQDIALKQSVLAVISQTPSENVVHLLQGATNDPDDEVRMIASTLLTRLEKSYMESIIRSENSQETGEDARLAGEAYLKYADSGLPVRTLRDRAIREALIHFQRAIESGEVLTTDTLSRLLLDSIHQKNAELEHLVLSELEKRGDIQTRRTGELNELFEDREFRSFSAKIAENTDGQTHEWIKKLIEWEKGREG
ncbi:MAG: hypothetical protein ACYDAM_09800 [Leptospirales bacterium]